MGRQAKRRAKRRKKDKPGDGLEGRRSAQVRDGQGQAS